MRFALAALIPVLIMACIGARDISKASPRQPTQASVFVIVMENQTFESAMSGSFTNSLAQRYAIATNYRAIGYPSVPNHLALTSGSTWGITSCRGTWCKSSRVVRSLD